MFVITFLNLFEERKLFRFVTDRLYFSIFQVAVSVLQLNENLDSVLLAVGLFFSMSFLASEL